MKDCLINVANPTSIQVERNYFLALTSVRQCDKLPQLFSGAFVVFLA